ncbi:MAG TPA: amidohydrolase family protein [Stellaceae bacterium]|nr:amidohydrolase family protein [Stellaceae bacterium]
MSYDLLIRNGVVVDGTGRPGRRADLAIHDGKIAEIGPVSDGAKRVIDASDLVVAPGFIDPHTHYDAQICWDPEISPSSWHGVTSVVMGNCGVGIAPCRPASREVAMRDLVNVEAIPYEVLDKGITWDWETFPQYLAAAGQRGSALNLGFLAPLTPFRHYVMGEASIERAATPEETARIKALLKEAVAAGALGFSTTALTQHIGHQGRPLACRNASRDEMKAYCNALRELAAGTIEIALTPRVSVVSDEDYALLDFMLAESARPVTFLALLERDDMPEACAQSRRRIEPLLGRGAVPQTCPRPLTREVSLKMPFSFASFDSWAPVFNKTVAEQAVIYRDPSFRNAFREELRQPRVFSGNWQLISVNQVAAPRLKALEGRSIAEIAAERGTDGVDTFLDIALEDALETEFTLLFLNVADDRVAALLKDPHNLLALGDGGAHVDLMCDAGYCTYLLGKWVRGKELMSLEHAVHRLTAQPADLFGIRDRGRLAAGLAADVVIFDPRTVGSPERPVRRQDLPGGGKRFVMPSSGIVWTIVNGEVTYAEGVVTGARAGQVLHS